MYKIWKLCWIIQKFKIVIMVFFIKIETCLAQIFQDWAILKINLRKLIRFHRSSKMKELIYSNKRNLKEAKPSKTILIFSIKGKKVHNCKNIIMGIKEWTLRKMAGFYRIKLKYTVLWILRIRQKKTTK